MTKKILLALSLLAALQANAAERKAFSAIDPDAITAETQVMAQADGKKHMMLAWWTPIEFWQAVGARQGSGGNTKALTDAFAGVTVIAVAETDISAMAAFDFYPKEEVAKNLVVTYTDAKGQKHVLAAQKPIDKNLEILLGIMKPILASAAGNFGNNLHFFVFDDRAQGGGKGRVIDPYSAGGIDIQTTDRAGNVTSTHIQLPLDSLFVPRMCPGERKAHVTWKFCPWDGTPLKD